VHTRSNREETNIVRGNPHEPAHTTRTAHSFPIGIPFARLPSSGVPNKSHFTYSFVSVINSLFWLLLFSRVEHIDALECDEYIKEIEQRASSVVVSLVKALFLRDHARWFRLGRQQKQLTWIQAIANVTVF